MTYRLSAVLTAAVLALTAGTAAASSVDTPEGVVVQPNYGSILASSLVNPDDPTYIPGHQNPLEGVLPPARDDEYSTLPWEGSDWGPDHLIYSSSAGVGQCQDFDVDASTGYLYAAFDTFHSTGDSIWVYRSTDQGVTWSSWGVCTNTDGELENAKIRVVTAGGYTWVCVLCLYDEASGGDTLWMRRWRTDGSNATWEQVDDDVIFADMDGDIGSSGYLYVTYVPKDASYYDVYAARNALSGAGWVNNVSLFGDADTHPYPAIAAGTGGVVSVAFIDTRLTTNDEVRIKRSTNYGSSWLDSQQVSNNSGGASLDDPDIAHARGTSAWICVSFDFSSSGINLGYYYSTNSGAAWTYGTTFPNVEDEYAGSMRASKGSGHNTIAYNVDPGDIVNFAWSNVSDPSDFTDPVQINDQAAVSWGPTAGWLTEGSFSAVEYTRTDYDLYFDSFNNTGIADGDVSTVTGLGVSPNPFMDVATISFSLDNGGPVSIEIFDMSGRLVTTLAEGSSFASGSHQVTWNGTASGAPVPGGVYICRMTSQGSTQSARMVL
ncbi:MAG: T9SS type A sorting domain-containing protein, partial [Candidatus Fermentibacter sp.]|nr:T9SS type A sorting domain-containing protein [Candidatus Fermentibacter sp.]